MAAREESSSLPAGFGTRPWLVQATRGKTLTLVDPSSDQSLHEGVIIPEVEGKTCLGCVHGGDWLVMLDQSTSECFLLSLAAGAGGPRRRRKTVPLPPLREPLEFLATCVVLGSPETPDCTVCISSTAEAGERFILHCRPSDREWTRLISPFRNVIFHSLIVSYKGKLHNFASSNSLIVLDVVKGGVVRPRLMGTIEDDEEASRGSGHYRLVESCGDLFVVWIQELGCFGDDGVPTGIAVYRLNLYGTKSMAWRKVEGIGDHRAFLISSGYGFSFAAMTESKVQGNCVYLVWSCCDCERLYKFCLDAMTISFHQVLPQPTHPWCRAFWSVPMSGRDSAQAMVVQESALSLSRLQEKSVNLAHNLDKHIDEEVQGTSCAPWRDLPLEMLELIVSNLSLVDLLRFPAVCKSWSKVSYPVERAKVWPWLMHCSKQDGTCKVFDPLRGKEYTLPVETFETDDERHIFRSSKDGWVVVSGGFEDECIFLINPFTGDLVEDLPMLERSYSCYGISFTSNPASPRCLFFGINSSNSGECVGVYTWRRGEKDWKEQEFVYVETPFPVAHNNPVLCRGKFYCLGRKGNLGVFDLESKDPRSAWKILDKPAPIHAEMDLSDEDHDGREFCYLVELEGELVSVFMRNAADPPRVFKLDETKMAWIEVENITGAALFLDIRASYAVASPEGGYGDKIFFPSYSEDGKRPAFYDMKTKAYHPSFYGLKQPLKCVWIVPSLQVDET